MFRKEEPRKCEPFPEIRILAQNTILLHKEIICSVKSRSLAQQSIQFTDNADISQTARAFLELELCAENKRFSDCKCLVLETIALMRQRVIIITVT